MSTREIALFGKNKKPLIFLFVSIFWFGYISFTAYQFYSQARDNVEFKIQEKISKLEYVLENGATALMTNHPDSLSDELSRAKDLYFIDFYILQENEDVVFFRNNTGKVEDLDHNYVNFNTVIHTPAYAFKTLKVGDYSLTGGVYISAKEILYHTAKLMMPLFIKDISVVTTLVGLICYFLLKDILSISKIISSNKRHEITNIKAQSKEANLILNASRGLNNENLRLQAVNETYGETIGPALRHEIALGRQAPYQFNATVCRVDLNGYTQMFFEKGVHYLTSVLNEYFARAREVIERYDGLIYQFVGDEIVFMIKEENLQPFDINTVSAAVIRDLFQEATTIESNLPSGAGHYFKLKASYAPGVMNFISLDEGHAFSGTPLIESVRLLSLIHEKNHQILAMDFHAFSKSCEKVAFVMDKEDLTLKGFKHNSTYVRCREFHSIEWLFENKEWDMLPYFRHDSHIEFVLKKLLIMSPQNSNKDIENVLSSMRFHKVKTTYVKNEVFLKTLQNFVFSEKEGLLSEKSLASLLSLYVRIIPQETWSSDLTSVITPLLDHKDSRVVANALVLLSQKGYDIIQLWDLMFSQSPRVAADTIYEISQRKLSWDMINALEKLSAVGPESAEYAKKRIISYYEKIDPVFAGSNEIISAIKNLKIKKTA